MEFVELTNQELALMSLSSLALIGSLDEYFYHFKSEKLLSKPECYKENILHALRTLIYSLLFFLIATYKITGALAIITIALFFADLIVGILDVLVEKDSRKKSGGLPKGEYLLHMMLSFHLGILYFNFIPYLLTASQRPSNLELLTGLTYPLLSVFIKLCSALSFIYFFIQFYYLLKSRQYTRKVLKTLN